VFFPSNTPADAEPNDYAMTKLQLVFDGSALLASAGFFVWPLYRHMNLILRDCLHVPI
jgi:hypothetical protein